MTEKKYINIDGITSGVVASHDHHKLTIVHFPLLISICLLFFSNVYGQSYSGGSGTESDPYKISRPSDFADLASAVSATDNYSVGKYFIVTATISTGVTASIGTESRPFQGNFNGNGKSINVTRTVGESYNGIFGWLGSGANIHDVITTGTITADNSQYVGAIVGNVVTIGTISPRITIKNCTNNAKITADWTGTMNEGGNIGGIAGGLRYADIVNCHNTAEITGRGNVGGLIGYYSYCTLEKCTNSGSVIGHDDCIGGIGGYSYSNVTYHECSNSGTISIAASSDYGETAGGLLGFAYTGNVIDHCYNTGTVTSTRTDSYNYGGLVGYTEAFGGTVTIRNSYNLGNVTTSNTGTEPYNSAGGIVGRVRNNTSGYNYIYNCYNIGVITVNGTTVGAIGGIVGINHGGGIYNCYSGNTIKVNGSNSNAGNVCGKNDGGTVQYCHYRTNVFYKGGSINTSVTACGSGSASNCYSFTHTSNTTDVCTVVSTNSAIGNKTTLLEALNYWRTNIVNDENTYLKWVADVSPWGNLGMPKLYSCTPITVSNFSVTEVGDRYVKVAWDADANVSYTLYYGSGAPADGFVVNNPANPFTAERLTNGRTYYFSLKPTGDGTTYCADNPLSTPAVEGNPNCQ